MFGVVGGGELVFVEVDGDVDLVEGYGYLVIVLVCIFFEEV